jgi:hypothetical protein
MNANMKTLRNGKTAAAVHAAAELSEEAAAFLKAGRPPRDYVETLIRNELYDDAVGFVAHVLAPRESVWWAWSCARDAAGQKPPAGVAAVLEAVRRWIVEPSDANRRAAGEAAEAIEYEFPAGMAGLAAFMCGDTLGPADAPPAPPPPGAAAQAIAGCICMAAAAGDPADIGARFKLFIARGMERADKGMVWAPDEGAAGS